MSKITIVLDKYSDWLESYSAIQANASQAIEVHTVLNGKTDVASLSNVYNYVKKEEVGFKYVEHASFSALINVLNNKIVTNEIGDVFVAPFVRYRDLWAMVPKCKGTVTVHLSECIPDTFGPLGYRIAFRGKKLKSWLTLPLAAVYAFIHKPDISYFPFYPFIKNPFVKNTYPIAIPPLLPSKLAFLAKLFKDEKRPLIISGFGYDLDKIVNVLNLDKYIATTKGMEIIVDGVAYPLAEKICAEEVLLSGHVSAIIGYNSSAMVWAKILNPDMEIQCYETSAFNRLYGSFFNRFSISALNKIGVKVAPERKDMLA